MNQSSNKKLYVGSLPYSTTEDELRDLFGQFGEVSSVRIISDKFTGQSKGFGFVEMVSDEDAQKAIESLNESQLGGRKLVVNVALPPQERAPGGGGRGGERRGGGGGRGGERRGGGGGGNWGGEGRRFRARGE